MKEMLKVDIDYTNSPLYACHNMPCPICRNQKANLNLNKDGDYFQPCWDCYYKGFRTLNLYKLNWFQRFVIGYDRQE